MEVKLCSSDQQLRVDLTAFLTSAVLEPDHRPGWMDEEVLYKGTRGYCDEGQTLPPQPKCQSQMHETSNLTECIQAGSVTCTSEFVSVGRDLPNCGWAQESLPPKETSEDTHQDSERSLNRHLCRRGLMMEVSAYQNSIAGLPKSGAHTLLSPLPLNIARSQTSHDGLVTNKTFTFLRINFPCTGTYASYWPGLCMSTLTSNKQAFSLKSLRRAQCEFILCFPALP